MINFKNTEMKTMVNKVRKVAGMLVMICGLMSAELDTTAQGAYIFAPNGGNQCLSNGCLFLSATVQGGLSGSPGLYTYTWYSQFGYSIYVSQSDPSYTICTDMQDNIYCVVTDSAGAADTTASIAVDVVTPPAPYALTYYDTVAIGGNLQRDISFATIYPVNVAVTNPHGGSYANYSTDLITTVSLFVTSATATDSGWYQVDLSDYMQVCSPVTVQVHVTVIPSGCHLTVADSVTNVTCSSNGVVRLHPAAGTAPYQYKLSVHGTWQSSNVFGNLAAGTDTFYVRDALGCSASIDAIIGQSSAVSVTLSVVAAGCTYNSATVRLTASGGVGPYLYRNGTNGAWQSNPAFTNLTSGTDTFYVQDANGCPQHIITTVPRNGGYPTVAPTSNSPIAIGDTLYLTSHPSGTSFSYSWTGPNGYTSTAANPVIAHASSAAGGTYYCTITNTAGCNANGLVHVTVTGSTCHITLTNTVTNASTCAANSGVATIVAAGGTAPYLYKKGANGTWQYNNVFAGLSAGIDTFYVRDTLGCSQVGTAAIGVGAASIPSVAVTVTRPSICSGQADTFTATPVNGGSSPFYQWYKNGLPTGSNSHIYINPSMQSGDSVWVTMTSSLSCASPALVTSAHAPVIVQPVPPAPVLTLLGGCLGFDSLALAGSAVGTTQFDWYLNGTNIFNSFPAQPYTIAGGNGTGPDSNQLIFPSGLSMDSAGYIYVADFNNSRIQRFPPGSTSLTDGVTVAGGNGYGSGANQLYQPVAVAVAAGGDIYVCDQHNQRIQKFAAGSTSATNGVTVAGGNGVGSAANQLNFPAGLCLDAAGNLYVTDRLNARIQKFAAGSTSATSGTTVAGGNGIGSAANQLNLPANITLDAANNLYIADQQNNRILQFPQGSTSATPGVTVAGGHGSGTAANQFNYPARVQFDSYGNMYVGDLFNERIQKFPTGSTSATNGVTIAGGFGTGAAANQFNRIGDILLVGNSTIYIADQSNNRVQKWVLGIDSFYRPSAAGSYTAAYTSPGGCMSALSAPITVALCTGDSVWPGDADHNGIADNNDLLPIGLGYGLTGILRTDQSIVWSAHYAQDWGMQFLNGTNGKHADCNGDAVINANDTTAILQNFGLTHNKTNGIRSPWRSGIPGITLHFSRDTVAAGDTLTVSLLLGDSATTVSNIYGLAFTYHYDALVVDTTSTRFGFLPVSFLGTDSNKISIYKDFKADGNIKAAVTGINHAGRGGFGEIARFIATITTGNINGKDLSYYGNLNFISDITAVDRDGNPISLNAGADSNEVAFEPTGIRDIAYSHILLYPNPAKDEFTIQSDASLLHTAFSLTDVTGRIVQTGTIIREITHVSISDLAAGVYMLQLGDRKQSYKIIRE